jgi:hypothetical protein
MTENHGGEAVYAAVLGPPPTAIKVNKGFKLPVAV